MGKRCLQCCGQVASFHHLRRVWQARPHYALLARASFQPAYSLWFVCEGPAEFEPDFPYEVSVLASASRLCPNKLVGMSMTSDELALTVSRSGALVACWELEHSIAPKAHLLSMVVSGKAVLSIDPARTQRLVNSALKEARDVVNQPGLQAAVEGHRGRGRGR